MVLLPQLVQVWDRCWDASHTPSEEIWEICSDMFRMSKGFQIVILHLGISYPGLGPEIIDPSFFYVHIGTWFNAYHLDLAHVTQYGWDGREQKNETNTTSQLKAELLIAVRISSLMEQVTEECPPVSKWRTEVLPESTCSPVLNYCTGAQELQDKFPWLSANINLDFHGQYPAASLRAVYLSEQTQLAYSACAWNCFSGLFWF